MASNLYQLTQTPEGPALEFNFHHGQERAWLSQKRFIFVLAGSQGGKTTFGPWWLLREIEQRGPGDYLAATASYDLFKLKMLPAMLEVFEEVLKNYPLHGRYWGSDRVIELSNPQTGKFEAKNSDAKMYSRIILRSASSGGGLESATAKGAWLDECGQDEFTVEAYEAVLRRLALAQGRILGTTTVYNLGWMRTKIWNEWVKHQKDPNARGPGKDIDIIQFPSFINPSYPMEEYERAKATMPEWRFKMFYRGEFAKPTGTIYDCFDTSNLIEPFTIPATWIRYAGVDFGGSNTALIYAAQVPSLEAQVRDDPAMTHALIDRNIMPGDYILYQEILEPPGSTEDYCRNARARVPLPKYYWGGAVGETQQRTDWATNNVPVQRPPIGDVETGILRVYALCKTRKLKVFNNCHGVIEEFDTYKRKLDDEGAPTEIIEDKRKFHRLDALRYLACGLSCMGAKVSDGFWV